MNKQSQALKLSAWGAALVTSAMMAIACGSNDVPAEQLGKARDALGNPGGAQACVVGTNTLRIASRVVTSGGLAANSLVMEPQAIANGGANINNVGGALVRISGATINGTVRIAGPAPTQANGQLINGAVINGPIITGAGQQAILPTTVVVPGTTAITVNSGGPAQNIAPGNYAAVTVNGSAATFRAGTYNLASLTINSGVVTFDTSAGPVTINVLGAITVNGGSLSSGNAALVTLYSNSSASNAVTINAGITSFPGTVTAPNGGVTIGSRVTLNGCVGGRNVNIEPDSRVRSIETLTVPTDGSLVASQFSYPAGTTVNIRISGLIIWGGCDPVSCPNGGSCGFIRLGDAQFHSDNCFTPPDPTFTVFGFPIQLFMNGAPLPATPFAPDHVYTFVVPGNNAPFVFNYNDLPGTFGDNSGTFSVVISAL